MAFTYKAIATVTVGSGGASNIEFTSIPGTYTDLVIKYSARCDQSGVAPTFTNITFNSNTSSYTYRRIYGDGSSATSSSGSAQYIDNIAGTGATASTFTNVETYIPNYAGSNNKSYSTDVALENNGTTAHTALYAGLWSNTAAITSVKLSPATGNYVQYTTATLYGIKNS